MCLFNVTVLVNKGDKTTILMDHLCTILEEFNANLTFLMTSRQLLVIDMTVIKTLNFNVTIKEGAPKKVTHFPCTNPIKHPIHAAAVGGAIYGAHGMHKRSKEADEKEVAAIEAKDKQDKEIAEFKKESAIKKEATVKGTTLGEVDLNTLVDQKHTWKIDANGDFVIP